MDYRVISIGTLSRHEIWGEKEALRTPHATTTLIRTADRIILVDPGLPTPALVARLHERTGLQPSAVTDVFLTCFRPAHRMGLSAFEHATWYISERERQAANEHLTELLRHAPDAETRRLVEHDLQILHRCKPAPDHLARQVDIFPLPGFTPGTCGLLLLEPNLTTLVAGDAVATIEHLERGQVLAGAWDVQAAKESLAEAIEIADLIIPGHDNITLNRTRRPF